MKTKAGSALTPWHNGGEIPGECRIQITWIAPAGQPYPVAEVAHHDGYQPGEHGEAHARLIAAAPTLLDACQAVAEAAAREVIVAGQHKRTEGQRILEAVRAAIAAAT